MTKRSNSILKWSAKPMTCLMMAPLLLAMGTGLTLMDAGMSPSHAQTNARPSLPSVNRPRPVRPKRPQRPKVVIPKPVTPFNPGRLVQQPKKKAKPTNAAPTKSTSTSSGATRKSAPKASAGSGNAKRTVRRSILPPPYSPSPRPLSAAFLDENAVASLIDRPHAEQILIVLIDGRLPPDTPFDVAETYDIEVDRADALSILAGTLVRFRLAPDQPIAEMLALMSGDFRLAAIQPDLVYEIQEGPEQEVSDSSEEQGARLPQYAPQRMGLDRLGDALSGKDITISIIDTGIDVSHRELAHAVARSHDATGLQEPDGPSIDRHGTAIASVIAANDALAGIAPGARLLDVRVFHKSAPGAPVRGTSHWIISGLDWSAGQGADIYNLSFAGPEDPLLGRAIENLAGQGAILIAAAGNNGPDAVPAYPAAYPAVVAVTATDETDLRYSEANRGGHIALSAPGVDIIAAAPDNAYDMVSGTSIAAAHVSGIAALLLESRNDLDPAGVHMALTSSAADLGEPGADPDFGAGLVAAPRAIEAALMGIDTAE